MLIAAALSTLALQSVGERPISASSTFRACESVASSLADERECLAAEVANATRMLEITAQAVGIDEESQTLWRRSVDHDCEAEAAMAEGGSSAGMRRNACWIEQMNDRADYLLRRGRW